MPPIPTISRAAMQALDHAAIVEYGIPSRVLMENAGREVASVVLSRLRALKVSQAVRQSMAAREDEAESPRTVKELEAWKASLQEVEGPVGVVCGAGNNGGDGFVVARTLLNHGVEVFCVLAGANPGHLKDDALDNFRSLMSVGGHVEVAEGRDHLEFTYSRLEQSLLIVDALFGIGLNRELQGVHRAAVELINRVDRPTISVDIPSGLDADSGTVHGSAVLADLTITLGAAKRGMTRGHGPDHCGRVEVAEIGIPRHLILRALEEERRMRSDGRV